ncbi:acyltransferase [Streptomyces sp. NBC_01619]|uniref:Acyltransferase n=1 Tax=Streptomyces pratisoli TaxID=3139917 RepID=A0ACC6QQE5_9ACTN|nr:MULTISPECIES: acyltransferase [unclassified Streptomyces]MCX4514942.1 acyltransferase [Streptomyces sp. NBC_01619]
MTPDIPTLALPRQRQEPAPHHIVVPAPRRGRITALDGLRLLAALMVVAYHYLARGEAWSASGQAMFPTAFPFAAYGWLGVELFFLISGFVICMSCWGRSVGDFFVSRVTRLYPAYWFAVLATTAVLLLVPGGQTPLPWPDVLTNLTMLQEPLGVRMVDGVYWTLFAELRFYLLFAIVAWRGLTYRRVVVFCCVWAVAGMAFSKFGDDALRLMIMPQHCWYFIAGMAFYLMYRFRPTLLLTGIVLLCFGAAVPSARSTWSRTLRYFDDPVPFWPVVAVLAVSFGLMGLVATGKLSWMNWRWLPYAGAATYPLYLLHQNIGWELIGVLESRVPGYLLVGLLVGGMLVVSWLVHRLVEKPLARPLKQRLNRALAEPGKYGQGSPRRAVD